MSISFNELRSILKLPDAYEHTSNLESLKTWCHQHVSQDIDYEGSAMNQYLQYGAFVANYLDNFLPHLADNPEEKLTVFGNQNAIHYAAQQGYDRFIAQLSISEEIINDADSYKMTPLHKAASQGHEHTVLALLSKGANVHLANAQNQLPVYSALFVPMKHDAKLLERKERIVHLLLPLTPEALTLQDIDGNSIAHRLATHSFPHLITSLLKDHPELAFVKNNAFHYPIHTAILNRQPIAMESLLAIPGVAELKDSQNCLALHYAARYSPAGMLESCCRATADINSRDSEGRTPLLWAASAGNIEAFDVLIENGADATLVDYKGFSLLHFAVEAQNEAMVRRIVDRLGEVLLNQVDAENQSPIFYARSKHNQSIEDFLISKGASPLPGLNHS